MKHTAAKTLGTAVLGAAFAAACAGTAAAAPAPLPDSAGSLNSVAQLVPAGPQALSALTSTAPQALAGAQTAVTQGLATAPETLQGATQKATQPEAPKDLLGSLLGGLPVGQVTQGLPLLGGLTGLGGGLGA
ncbi:ATP-binding protein [Streptomyces sp. NPDC057638]|uniref:ATP-binding protein n=1 Tax=Streptomyces sp. NPDC057638 TaxID=3346190 RepID=UPI0036BE6003